MKKIGRNDTCYCGSGLKHKKCHGLIKKEPVKDEKRFIPPSVYQLIIHKYFTENEFTLDLELLKYKESIFEEVLRQNENESGEMFLKIYLVETEVKIKEIASKYTIYEMLYWSRRLGPKNIFNVADLSVMLYREIQTQSIYKYGNEDSIVSEDKYGSIHPDYMIELSNMDFIEALEKIKSEKLNEHIINVLSDVIRLEILAFVFLRASQDYRILNKGGAFRIDADKKCYFIDTTKDIDYLIDVYDKRLKNANLFSMTGAHVEDSNPKSVGNGASFCPHFQLNVKSQIKTQFNKHEN